MPGQRDTKLISLIIIVLFIFWTIKSLPRKCTFLLAIDELIVRRGQLRDLKVACNYEKNPIDPRLALSVHFLASLELYDFHMLDNFLDIGGP